MSWKYAHNNNKALHIPTGGVFNIEFSHQAELKITLASESPKGIPTTQLSKLIPELMVIVKDEGLKHRMGSILRVAFGGDYTAAAYILKQSTGKNVSERTLQSWLMQTGKKSSRKCPEWAVNALHDYVEKNPNELVTFKSRREQRIKSEFEHGINRLERARNTDGLEDVERSLGDDEHFRNRVKSASLVDLPNVLSDILLKHEQDINTQRRLIFDIFHAISEATSLDELKKKLNDRFDSFLDHSNFIYQAKQQVIAGENEFSNEYGLLDNAT